VICLYFWTEIGPAIHFYIFFTIKLDPVQFSCSCEKLSDLSNVILLILMILVIYFVVFRS